MTHTPRLNTASPFLPQGQQMPIPQALQIAAQQIDAGRLPPAEAILRQILDKLPTHAEALHLMGVLAYQAGKAELAVELIGKAIASKPDNAHFYANRGEMLRLLKRLDEAIQHGETAVRLAPGQAVYYSNLGIAYYDQKNHEQAEMCQRKALALNPDLLIALNNMGSILRERKQRQEAVSYFRRALQIAPDHWEAMNNLGSVLVELERPDEAIPLLLKVLQAQPENAAAHGNLANALVSKEDFDRAQLEYCKVLAIHPGKPDALLGLARVFFGRDQPEQALPACQQAVLALTENSEALVLLGDILLRLEHYDAARDAYEQALSIDAQSLGVLLSLGVLQMELGHLDEAQKIFSRAMAIEPENLAPYLYMADVKKMSQDDPCLRRLEAEVPRIDSLLESKAVALHFALGKAYDDTKQYDRAFPHFAAGCRMKRARIAYDPDDQDRLVQNICDLFSRKTVESLQGSGDPSDLPIFVLGMPRSGTTLVETIIASHPDVYGAGELRDLLTLAAEPIENSLGNDYPLSLHGLQRDDLARMGARYVAGLRKRSATARHITDKMPANFLAIGLIHLMLPNARIIHVKRNAADICLSSFTRRFSHGLYHSYDLREMGRYYVAYARLMDYWREVLPRTAFFEVQYEELVMDKEAQTRRLIDYCGLAWHDACLESHKTERVVKTASITQVRQPVYQSSVERWRSYEAYLQPLLEELRKYSPCK